MAAGVTFGEVAGLGRGRGSNVPSARLEARPDELGGDAVGTRSLRLCGLRAKLGARTRSVHAERGPIEEEKPFLQRQRELSFVRPRLRARVGSDAQVERLVLVGHAQSDSPAAQRRPRAGEGQHRRVAFPRDVHEDHVVYGRAEASEQMRRLLIREVTQPRSDAALQELWIGPVVKHLEIVVGLQEHELTPRKVLREPARDVSQVRHDRCPGRPSSAMLEHQRDLGSVVRDGHRGDGDGPDEEGRVGLERSDLESLQGERSPSELGEEDRRVEVPCAGTELPDVVPMRVGGDDGVEVELPPEHASHALLDHARSDARVHQDSYASGLYQSGVPAAAAREDRDAHRRSMNQRGPGG